MQITRYTDYSIRILIYLAVNNGKLSTIREIADSYQVSKNHLMKIVQDLNIRGYLQTLRGKNGGLHLNTEPKNINIGKLIREIESETTFVECAGSDNQCIITPSCQLKEVFAEALESFYTTLEKYTLQDLVGGTQRNELQHILLGPVAPLN